MRIGILCFISLLSVVPVVATPTRTLDTEAASDPVVKRVLTLDPIQIHTHGSAETEFEAIARELNRPNLVMDVQRTYARMLPAGRQPEFVIRPATTNTYYYVNKNGERSDIREVLRRNSAPGTIRCVYHVKGQRFFGPFESVIQIDARQEGAKTTCYEIDVYAHPEVTVTRFLARHLPFIYHYFQSKTRDVASLVVSIVRESLKDDPVRVSPPP
jgi:hypothetical protein